MSLLSKTLNRIDRCLQKNYPEIAASLQPGLSYAEIAAQVASLPFQLPREFYELYQWKNGIAEKNDIGGFYKNYRFLPLEEALTEYPREGIDSWILNEVFPYAWIPIFAFEGEYFGMVGSQQQRYSSPIVYLYHSEDVTHTSLTSTIQEIAECYEKNIYFLEKLEYGSSIQTHQEAENNIHLKYNPEIIPPSSYENLYRETIQKSPHLKIINTYSRNSDCLFNTNIINKEKNENKLISYLGGKIIRIQVTKISHKSVFENYIREERYYGDRDVFESQTVVKQKGWFRREKKNIKRRYINNTLKYEKII